MNELTNPVNATDVVVLDLKTLVVRFNSVLLFRVNYNGRPLMEVLGLRFVALKFCEAAPLQM
jgi:hypothetical protein